MVHIGAAVVVDRVRGVTSFGVRSLAAQQSVLVVRDDGKNNDFVDAICEFLDIGVEHATSGDDLAPMLRRLRPMAVIADLEGEGQDGYHVMKVAAGFDKALPVMLLTANDQALLGAVDAVREVWDMSHVVAGANGIGTLVDFICHAARDAGRSRLIRT
jgi:CheY-like chemotaxis protein